MRNAMRHIVCALAALAAASLLHAQPAAHVEVTSLLGRSFPSLPDSTGAVAAAEKALAADPKNPKLILKLSQAQAGVWQENEAVATCTRGLAMDPNNADLLTERGHRELPLRQFDQAKKDLSRALEVDPKQT